MASAPSCVMVTGANVGIGLECARQLALTEGIQKVLLACRSQEKAAKAKEHLERITQKENVFEIVIVDVSNLESVREAVKALQHHLDGIVLNAGGAGGPDPKGVTKYGVTNSIAVNVLGHVLLVEELMKTGKLSGTVVFSGSESARGVPEMGLPTPELQSGSVEEFVSICNGSFWTEEEVAKLGARKVSMHLGSYSKFVGTLWMMSMARKHESIRFVTISPGATSGTTTTRDLPFYEQAFVRTLVYLFTFVGKSHAIDVGAKRYLDALIDSETYQSGIFYASKKGLSGPVSDQSEYLEYFGKGDQHTAIQDSAFQAIHAFLK